MTFVSVSRSPFRASALVAAAVAGTSLLPSAAWADEEGEDKGPHVVIGKTIGADSLTFGFEATDPDPTTGAVIIPINTFEDPIPFTGKTGFRNIPFDLEQDLAFEAPGADEVEELEEFGFDAVPETSSIVLEAVTLPSDFAVFLPGQPLLESTGASLALGNPEFDLHPLYILATTDSATLGQSTTGTFRFVDTSGALSPSGSFDLTLQVVPEPSAAALTLIGGAALLRRRRAARG